MTSRKSNSFTQKIKFTYFFTSKKSNFGSQKKFFSKKIYEVIAAKYCIRKNICLNRELEQNLKTGGESTEPLVKLQVKKKRFLIRRLLNPCKLSSVGVISSDPPCKDRGTCPIPKDTLETFTVENNVVCFRSEKCLINLILIISLLRGFPTVEMRKSFRKNNWK